MKKSIGILGGMGPLATLDLMKKIVSLTSASGDKEHIHIYVDNNTGIPDRSDAIVHDGESPIPELLSSINKLVFCGADCILIPCNTAHYYLDLLQKETAVPILNMVSVTAEKYMEKYKNKTAAILATEGTLSAGLYQKELSKRDIAFVVPNASEMSQINYLIYNIVKSAAPYSQGIATWNDVISSMKARGAECFILACTELPILADYYEEKELFIDPTTELAKEAIRYCGYELVTSK